MKKNLALIMSFFITMLSYGAFAQNAPQAKEDFFGHTEEGAPQENKEDELSKREAIKVRTLQDRIRREHLQSEMDALREASADATEYTVAPGSVELLVQMASNNFGFKNRSHRMTMTAELDFFIRGRAMLHYDYRFLEYLSFGVKAGVDWTALSLWSRFGRELVRTIPRQLSVLAGASAKWRVTEWSMNQAFFLEPSLLFGRLWQSLPQHDTTHWRVRPGIFGSLEKVYDSGFVLSLGLGAEFPIDFAEKNVVSTIVDPLVLVGVGLAL